MKLPRKAAYFTVVAAEAMSAMKNESAQTMARDLWLLSTQLYSTRGNPCDHGGEYGWACLRAITLTALAIQDNGPLSHHAAEELLALLCETQSKLRTDGGTTKLASSTPTRRKAKDSKDSPARNPRQTADGGAGTAQPVEKSALSTQDASLAGSDENESVSHAMKASNFTRQLRQSFTTMTANSSILTLESKWADDAIIPTVDVPLSDSLKVFPTVQPFGLVWKSVNSEKCAAAQTRCMERISLIRRALPTSSVLKEATFSGDNIPLYISEAMTIQPDPLLELEKVKKVATPKKNTQDAMSTFYNPFDSKRSTMVKVPIVAEDEERCMSVAFGNRLSVPLEIQRCQLVFEGDVDEKVKSTPLSFIVPAKAKKFVVLFPFSVLAIGKSDKSQVFEVKGIHVTFLGRSTLLSVGHSMPRDRDSDNIPPPAWVYPFLKKKKEKRNVADEALPKFETCCWQPRLQVHWAKTNAPVDSEAAIPIRLADGELFSVPLIKLRNYAGPSGHGLVERIQLLTVDLPGLPVLTLYDSEVGESCKKSEEEFMSELMELSNPPPLKVRVRAPELSLDGINQGSDKTNALTIQIAAAHNVKQQIKDGTKISIRFRYRGLSTSNTEVWRKREVTFSITCIDGPRVSSMDFRPDLSAGSSFIQMCNSLRQRRNFGESRDSTSPLSALDNLHECDQLDMLRVGMDEGFHVANKDCVFILTIANETLSEVTLSRECGVGGFRNSPLTTIRVHAGVSAKLPIVTDRIPRMSSDGTPIALLDEIVKRTSFMWETIRQDDSYGASSEQAKGYLRVPREALDNIILQHPSFLSLICESPCEVVVTVSDEANASDSGETYVSIGEPVTVKANVAEAAWVPLSVKKKCSVTTEWFCTRKEKSSSGINMAAKDYAWCGKLQQTFRMADSDKSHQARIVFLNSGLYSVSACARISNDDSPTGAEEIWWAPVSATVTVVECQPTPAQ